MIGGTVDHVHTELVGAGTEGTRPQQGVQDRHAVGRRPRLHDGGDHAIVVAEITRLVLGDDAPPLLYHGREYRRLQ